jgi:hypothetical protein
MSVFSIDRSNKDSCPVPFRAGRTIDDGFGAGHEASYANESTFSWVKVYFTATDYFDCNLIVYK